MFKTLALALVVAMATTSSVTSCADFPKTRAGQDAPALCFYVGSTARRQKLHCPKHHATCPEACGMCPGLDNAWDHVVTAIKDFEHNDGTFTDYVHMETCKYVSKSPSERCSLTGATQFCQATCA